MFLQQFNQSPLLLAGQEKKKARTKTNTSLYVRRVYSIYIIEESE